MGHQAVYEDGPTFRGGNYGSKSIRGGARFEGYPKERERFSIPTILKSPRKFPELYGCQRCKKNIIAYCISKSTQIFCRHTAFLRRAMMIPSQEYLLATWRELIPENFFVVILWVSIY